MTLQKVDSNQEVVGEKKVRYPAMIEEGFDYLSISDPNYHPFRIKIDQLSQHSWSSPGANKFEQIIYLKRKETEGKGQKSETISEAKH